MFQIFIIFFFIYGKNFVAISEASFHLFLKGQAYFFIGLRTGFFLVAF